VSLSTTKQEFVYVKEWDSAFLTLFPHRFDYIYAPHPELKHSPEWKTESRHPLSDRLIQQSTYLYGVRFGAETNYCLLDIDAGSIYHPKHDAIAISRIAAALEPIGLASYVVCTSSYSGGLHLYFPFQNPQSSWQLAIALTCLLENAGFKVQPGQLEVFPNPKPYSTDGVPSLFNAHRLPMQIGSYLLDRAFQPIWSNDQTFVKQWQLIQEHNDIDSKTLKQILKQAKRKHFAISGKAEKFVNDLNAEIELGWTGYGQTNRLLGRITMRTYIFHHILFGGEPLEGKALIDEIIRTARSLPGYVEWCQHQHEIEHRAEEWASCIEESHYFHFGDQSEKPKSETQDPELIAAVDQSPTWNQRQSAATRDRIRRTIADLLEKTNLPAKATARFQALLQYSIGGASLYRHRDLWHPNYLNIDSDQNLTDGFQPPVENPPDPPSVKMNSQLDCENASNWHSSTSLLSTNGGDNPSGKVSSDRTAFKIPINDSNSSANSSSCPTASELLQEAQYVQQALFSIQAQQEAFQEAVRITQAQRQRIKSEAAEQRHIDRMQQFLDSGDPILVAEAMAWTQVNPGVLQADQLQLSLLQSSFTGQSGNRASILAAIEIQAQQLAWSAQQVSHHLQQRFDKNNLALLSDSQLMHWLEQLSHMIHIQLPQSSD
jgi:hypothetical protein